MKRLVLAAFAAAVALGSTDVFAQKKKPPKPPVTPTTPTTTPPKPPPKPSIVKFTVVEVAGSRAYIDQGEKAGVRQGGTVQIKGRDYKVAQSSDSFAVIDLRDDSVHEKDEGRAMPVAEVEIKPLPTPPALSTWQNGWTVEQPLAANQTPAFVPLGEAARSRKWDVRLGILSGGLIPLGGQVGASIGFVQLDAKVHAEPFSVPAALDFDGSLRFYAAQDLGTRIGSSARSFISVRELLAHYGTGGWYAGLGRMKYASSTLGTLDGLRVQAPLGAGFTIGAFGGLLPNPLSGALSLDAQRFGIEARFSRPEAKLHPDVALVVHGSTFDGKLDERRVSAIFGIYPGLSRIGGHVEVSNFDKDNPWKASAIEVTAAGVDQSLRYKGFEFGARADLLQPERSRWLASYLPTSWFCRPVATAGVAPSQEPCETAANARLLGALNVGLTVGKVSFGIGGTSVGDISPSNEARTLGAFATARVVRLANVLRFEAAGSAQNSTYMTMFSGTGGFGLTLIHDTIDFSAYYRRTQLRYPTDSSSLAQNSVGGAVVVFPTSTMMFTMQGEGIQGDDVNYLSLLGTAVWRPRF